MTQPNGITNEHLAQLLLAELSASDASEEGQRVLAQRHAETERREAERRAENFRRNLRIACIIGLGAYFVIPLPVRFAMAHAGFGSPEVIGFWGLVITFPVLLVSVFFLRSTRVKWPLVACGLVISGYMWFHGVLYMFGHPL